jgi:hypothetical protein
MRCNILLHRTKELPMARAIESLIDRLMAPFAEELARLPASAFRQLLNGL